MVVSIDVFFFPATSHLRFIAIEYAKKKPFCLVLLTERQFVSW